MCVVLMRATRVRVRVMSGMRPSFRNERSVVPGTDGGRKSLEDLSD